jgi:hypothetical protein
MHSMEMISAGAKATIDRYIGYYETYATSHSSLDHDAALQEEVRNAAATISEAVLAAQAGKQVSAGSDLAEPRPK